MKKLYKIIQFLASWVTIVGLLFVCLLTTYSIVLLKVGNLNGVDTKFDFSPLLSSKTLAWFWIVIFISCIMNFVIKVVLEFKRGLKVLKNDENKITLNNILKWFINN